MSSSIHNYKSQPRRNTGQWVKALKDAWTPERREAHSELRLRQEEQERAGIECDIMSGPISHFVERCACGAIVVPHVRERAPFQCSPCREQRVYAILASRKMAAD